jgi:hypothetical protein
VTTTQGDPIKHLEMIQGIVNRMAANSFTVKGWSVAAGAALLALAFQTKDRDFLILAIIPVVGFWGLDAYYLRRERLFRKLFDHARRALVATPDNPLTPQLTPFCMDTKPYEREVDTFQKTLWAPVVKYLHGPVVAAAVVIYLFWR